MSNTAAASETTTATTINLLNINKMVKLLNTCKCFLVMLVVISTSFPAATVMARSSSLQQNREYKNDKIATISQSVNSSSLLETQPDDELLHNDLLDSLRGTHNLSNQPMYTNEFAVHILGGKYMADRIANKYNYINMGQIGSLEDYYLFHHKRISLRTGHEHHNNLADEPEVQWIEQQYEKVRVKRDGSSSSIGGDSPLLSRVPQNIFPDPLFKDQWFLQNGGAEDDLGMNIGQAWQKGYTGKGVVVTILDDGLQINHPDLAQNYDPNASFDINDNDTDPTPRDTFNHGTRCAGGVAAVAFNNYCGVGVAYNASIGGVRMLDGRINDVVEAQGLSLNPSHIDIYSSSWGPVDDGFTLDGPGLLARRAFIDGVTKGRQGKGSIYVWASGNGGRFNDSCSCDGYTNSIFTLSISSATQAGLKPWYTEKCSSTLATTYSSGTTTYSPAHGNHIVTTEMDALLRPDHICTDDHTGTSVSAPLAAGICALALEANSNLTWRDMQYLVVYTSRSSPLEKESGWMLNGVKRKYSHKFGYGLMDAGAMVSLAEQWSTVPPQHICKSTIDNKKYKIDIKSGYTLVTHMDVDGCAGAINEVRYLEHVQCRIGLKFYPRGDLRIVLTSPMGTTSTLLFERPRDINQSNFDDWPFLSVHFWGENPEGKWTLQIINSGVHQARKPGYLLKWQLIFYGTAVQPMRLKNDLVSQPVYTYPTETDLGQPIDQFSSSSPEQAITSEPDNETELHDSECDSRGCYGRGPTYCGIC